jgi:hypothetical protein
MAKRLGGTQPQTEAERTQGAAGIPAEGLPGGLNEAGPVTPALSVSDDATVQVTPAARVDALIAANGPVSENARKFAVALDWRLSTLDDPPIFAVALLQCAGDPRMSSVLC